MRSVTRFSVLDRSRTREGHDAAEALRDTVRLAQELEGLGYHRIWVSEHHGVPGVAGSAPTVLAAAVAAATPPQRGGSRGGVGATPPPPGGGGPWGGGGCRR
ncbi:LLM class flavin-dependent oxidoreductase, partial [Streptomyces sp. NPDC127044]